MTAIIRLSMFYHHQPIATQHEMIGDPTLADAILDRLFHNAHKLVLKGKSMRKRKQKLPAREHLRYKDKTCKRIELDVHAKRESVFTLTKMRNICSLAVLHGHYTLNKSVLDAHKYVFS